MDENLLNRVREALVDVSPIEEKRMFGGVCFMVDDKLCICVNSHEMLCRINPDEFEAALELDGVRPMEQRAVQLKVMFLCTRMYWATKMILMPG
jgi:TfoX/Sxy family transcriptional regulator of competence genes